MTAPPEVLDLAFAWMLRATAQASAVILLILAARLVLRDRLGAGGRYGLWALLVLPLVGGLLPAGPFALSGLLVREGSRPTVVVTPEVPPPTGPAEWAVQYGPVDLPAKASSSVTTTRAKIQWSRIAAIVWVIGAGALAVRVAIAHF